MEFTCHCKLNTMYYIFYKSLFLRHIILIGSLLLIRYIQHYSLFFFNSASSILDLDLIFRFN